jgi:hypothetical protein
MRKFSRTVGTGVLAAGLLVAGGAMVPASAACAQSSAAPDARARDNLLNLIRTTIEFEIPQDTPLSAAIGELALKVKEQRGVDLAMEVLWRGESDGLDRDFRLPAIATKGLNGLEYLEKVLLAGSPDRPATWQLTPLGSVQIGLKESLNRFRRIVLYDIQDLLLEIPNFDQAPEIDLDRVLQYARRGGGGGGGSPFRQNQQQRPRDQRTPAERSVEIVDIIRQYVEPDQWFAGLPEPRFWQGNLIIDAPDYIHRGINGYPWLPRAGKTLTERPQRFVAMTTDSAGVVLAGRAVNPPAPGGVDGQAGGVPASGR